MNKLSIMLLSVFLLSIAAGCREEAVKKPEIDTISQIPQTSGSPPKKTSLESDKEGLEHKSNTSSQQASDSSEKLNLDRIVYYNNGELFWALGHGAVYFSDNIGKQWTDMTPKGVSIDTAGTGFDLFAFHHGADRIDVYEHSFDPQQEWTHSVLPTKEKWEISGTLLFANYLVGADNWLLVESDSTNGTEKKALYRISEDDRQWTRIQDISGQVVGRASGITIRSSKEGWITCSGGNNDIILYHTTDGGLHWTKEKLPVPEETSKVSFTANVFAPVFDEEGDSNLILPVEIIYGSEQMMTYYYTYDAGKSWILSTSRYKNVKPPPAYYPDQTYGRGTALGEQGEKLYHFALDDYSDFFDGPVPQPLEIKLKTNLRKATQLFFRVESNEGNDRVGRGWALLDGELVVAQDGGAIWQRQ